jgi:hypothetical protein
MYSLFFIKTEVQHISIIRISTQVGNIYAIVAMLEMDLIDIIMTAMPTVLPIIHVRELRPLGTSS